jgi:hypothetical protein
MTTSHGRRSVPDGYTSERTKQLGRSQVLGLPKKTNPDGQKPVEVRWGSVTREEVADRRGGSAADDGGFTLSGFPRKTT